jgi:hypothetical protein
MGLSALLIRPAHSQSLGGRGVGLGEVLQLLRATTPPPPGSRSPLLLRAGPANATAAAVLQNTPLLTGHLLAVAFLGQYPNH